MPGRNEAGDGYGFNGMEKDDEVKGSGNSYDFGARMYDSRLGRWLSVDAAQISFVGYSPYNYVLNNPLLYIDPDGNQPIFGSDAEAKIVATDLNAIFTEMYGETGATAFRVVYKTEVVKMVNPDYGWWDKWGGGSDSKWITGEKSGYYIETDENFNWNADDYSREIYDAVNMQMLITTAIVADTRKNDTGRCDVLEGSGGGNSGESFESPITLSDQLLKTGDKKVKVYNPQRDSEYY
jgi:RHS repeat-associated protein